MLAKSLGLAGLASCALGVGAFVGCGLQTDGLASSTATTSSGSATPPASSTGSAHPAASGTGGHGAGSSSSTSSGGAGGNASQDAGIDAPVDAPIDAPPDTGVIETGPTLYSSCSDILAANPSQLNGVQHLVDSSHNVYEAYCDMTDDGGGWTLALKIDGNMTNFPYSAAAWTNNTAVNPDKPDLDTIEAKLASYWSVPVSALRVGMIDGDIMRWLVVPVAGVSLLDLVNNVAVTDAGRGAWEGLLRNGSLQTNCNWEGINPRQLLRIGIVGDDTCGNNPSPDSYIGFGAQTVFQGNSPDCGNIARYGDDNNDQTTPTFGYVMVR